MQQVHLFQLILHFLFFLQDGREKSFLSWAQKQKGVSARAVGCQTGFLPSQTHTRVPTENATGASTGGVDMEVSCPMSVKIILKTLKL